MKPRSKSVGKLVFFQYVLMPNISAGIGYLRQRDDDSTGADDEAANALEAALAAVETYLEAKEKA